MPLRKSNSELVGPYNQHRSPWQRSRSGPANPSAAIARPLVPVSAETKSKLSKFQFLPALDPFDADKENAAAAANDAASVPGKTSPSGLSRDDSAITPVTRMSWRDLEPKVEGDRELNLSPTERLLWIDRCDTSYAAAMSPVMVRRNRKRARSSSPTSSPSNDVTHPKTPSVNVHKLAQALRSPHADPTLELWDRFTSAGRKGAPIGLAHPALAQAMVSSSPRPVRPAGDGGARGEASLRRTIGLGRNWTKRRRVERLESPAGGDHISEESKTSLVSALLDSVTSSIHDSDGRHEDSMSAKSPSPRKSRSQVAEPSVGLAVRGGYAASEDRIMEELAAVDSDQTIAAAGSDYGDDEFDDDTFIEIADGLRSVEPAAEDREPVRELEDQPRPASWDQSVLSDDFGDVEDNIFDAAEELMVKAAATAPKQPAENAMPPSAIVVEDDSENAFGEGLEDAFGDDFGGDFDFEAAELAATQSTRPPQSIIPTSQKPKAIQRYLVTNVLETEYVDGRDRRMLEKILILQVDNTKTYRTVHLRGEWHDTPASAKSFVHIIGDFSVDGRCVIDDDANMIILHPDQLISATVVADSFTCMRRAVLQDRVKATGDMSAPLVYGTILHEIFQEALMANKWDLAFLTQLIDRILEKHVEDLYTIKVSMAIAREHLQSKMRELSSWAAAFVSAYPRPDAVVTDRGNTKANMCVSKLLDVEEHVWSPMYGLKGNIDATVQVIMKDGNNLTTLTVPFEVKTGKHASENHMAQTALYTLLLSDRYDIEVTCGILYYMETSQTTRIPAIRNELKHMVMQRNRLACYIRERNVQLPPMKKSKNTCGKCYAKSSCFIYHRLADDGDGASSGMDKLFDVVVQHLTPTHKEFFLKWEDLLTKEEKESHKLKRELWTMVSADREKVGRCFSDVVIEEGSAAVEQGNLKINRYRYTFIKRKPLPGFSFLESQLVVGEPVVVSDEQGHFALALGYVTSVHKQRISVAVDRRLHNARIRQPGFDEANNQVFASIMEVAHEGSTPEQSQGRIKVPPIRYRLDKDEFSNGMSVVRNNLVQVMADGVFGSREIRRLVVDRAPPRFKAEPTQYVLQDRASLNVDQRRAIQKVMSAQDYALVLGMPGTGKTTTIAHIIRALTSQGKSVLLTSYTHTAVDNILLKLKSDGIPVLRLGATAKVHPEVRDFAILAAQPMTTFDEIKEAWHDTPIVATTCLGIGHPLFKERTFDYCIVDEASQITLPVCLGPIRMAQTFVLVGDHNQLPPLVQNEDARRGGLDISLFKLLSDAHPASVVGLEHQYRMCEDIMTLSNTLIYEGRLRCGTEELRTRKLDVPDMAALRQRHHHDASSLPVRPGTPLSFCTGASSSPSGPCWLRELLDPEARVRFVNTDTLLPRAAEEARGSRIVNHAEASVVVQLVEALLTAGVPESEVGVMTHYRSQLSLLRHGLRGRAGVEMHTADRFQGRDKEVVVLSLVRSNESGNIGDLLKDWRRINVAFTRAKTKLLVVGSRETLRGGGGNQGGKEEMVSRFVGLMEEKRWVYDLPGDALTSHFFEEAGTQATTTVGPSGAPGRGSPAKKRSSPTKSQSPKTQARGRSMAAMMMATPLEGDGSADKENRLPGEVKRAAIGEKVLLKGKPILRDILNDMTNGAY